jgi:hypothetical protein
VSATRLAWSTVAAAALGWGILAACGSTGRPPPAETGTDGGANGDGGVAFDGGSFVPGSSGGGPCFDERAETPLPDFGITVTADGSTGCVCTAQSQKGLVVELPCGTSVCATGFDGLWDCTIGGEFHFYRGGGVGTTCDAATIPLDAAPCTPPR